VNFGQYLQFFIFHFALGSLSFLFSGKAIAAERITLNVPPLGQFYIQVSDLENFIQTGEKSPELAFYLNRLPPKQVERLPELLSTQLELNPLSIAKFSNSTIGEAIIQNFGKGIRSKVNLNGFFALRGAIIAAAFDEKGLTIINLLEQFPLENIYIDLPILNQYLKQGETLLKNRDALEREFFATDENPLDRVAKSDKLQILRLPGHSKWKKSTIAFRNPRRSKPGYFDLYQPEAKQSVPLVIISHGLASDRQTFAYLAQHFVSHGLAVAVIEHDGISQDKFDYFLSGKEKFPEPNNLIDQPLDIKYLLDQLELESKINPQEQYNINFAQVGVIGQSFGGYTSLALAGGNLIADPLAKECQPENYRDVLLDLSSLARCTLNKLETSQHQLKDSRIKAVISINPLGKIFGQAGMSSIDIPIMIVSGTHDLITPPVVEQLNPFTWLSEDIEKYLVLVKPGTHFSFLQRNLDFMPIADNVSTPNTITAHPIIQALGTAFFKTYLAEETKYTPYFMDNKLEQSCIEKDCVTPHTTIFNNSNFESTLIRSLTEIKLQEIIGK